MNLLLMLGVTFAVLDINVTKNKAEGGFTVKVKGLRKSFKNFLIGKK